MREEFIVLVSFRCYEEEQVEDVIYWGGGYVLVSFRCYFKISSIKS